MFSLILEKDITKALLPLQNVFVSLGSGKRVGEWGCYNCYSIPRFSQKILRWIVGVGDVQINWSLWRFFQKAGGMEVFGGGSIIEMEENELLNVVIDRK